MRTLFALAAVGCSNGAAPADAAAEVAPHVEAGERLLKGDGFRVVVPESWRDLPELHPPGTTGVTVGDPREAVFLTVVETTAPGQKDAHAAGRVFLAELERTLTESGAVIRRWEVEDTPRGVRARTALDRGDLRAEGVRLAILDEQRVLHGWSADCLSRAAAPSPACERVLGSFQVTR
jgi:hypothetical protein